MCLPEMKGTRIIAGPVDFKIEYFIKSAIWKRVQGVILMSFCYDLNVIAAFAATIPVLSYICH